jgi:spermidine/putrescine transport system permease protein
MVFFAAIRLPLGLTTVILSHIAFSIPFVDVVIRARMASFDPALEEAAHDLGASRWQSFRHVTLPHLMVGIVASALLVATLSLDDFVITFFTSGPGATTLPLKIYSMARFSVTPEINAASTVLMALTVMLVLGAVAIQTRWRR